MVGDGCNDCGALRTADAGISLSMADASVAAPFTSQETNISCVAPLIREGRTTLDAAFGTFQFATGICFIFFAGVLMLYSTSNGPSDFQYFVWDFATVLVPFFCIGNVAPPEYLVARRPLRHLWGFLPMFSFFTFLFWQILALVIGWLYCHAQPWFTPYVFDRDVWPPNPSYEETTMFWILNWSCITAAFVFSPNEPYSLNFVANRVFTIWSLVAIVMALCMMFVTDEAFVHQMNFKTPPHVEYKLVILALSLAAGLLCYCWEKYLIRGWLYQWMWPRLNRVRQARHLYQKIEKELRSKPEWPKLGTRDVTKKTSEIAINVDGEHVSRPVGRAERQFATIVSRGSSFNNKLGNQGGKVFRTFQGSRRGGYTINGPQEQQEASEHYDGIPVNEDFEDFPPPPPSTELYNDVVETLAIRSLDDQDAADAHRDEQSERDAYRHPLRSRQGVLHFGNEAHQENYREHEPDVQLLGYRSNRRPSDLSPSQQRRHLNGHV